MIGGGQAGLAVSHALTDAGSSTSCSSATASCTPGATTAGTRSASSRPTGSARCPGTPTPATTPTASWSGRDPRLRRGLRARFPPLMEGVAVTAYPRRRGVRVETSHGDLTADAVVLAVGGYHAPKVPGADVSARSPASTPTYRNPHSLPDGKVLVVGTGQSGAQIAEDLHLAGREVHLAVGTAPRVARFYRGRDCVAWLHDMGHYRMPITEHPQGSARARRPTTTSPAATAGRPRPARVRPRRHGAARPAPGRRGRRAALRRRPAGEPRRRRRDHGAHQGRDRPPDRQPAASTRRRSPATTPVWAPPGDGSARSTPPELSAIVWATGFPATGRGSAVFDGFDPSTTAASPRLPALRHRPPVAAHLGLRPLRRSRPGRGVRPEHLAMRAAAVVS